MQEGQNDLEDCLESDHDEDDECDEKRRKVSKVCFILCKIFLIFQQYYDMIEKVVRNHPYLFYIALLTLGLHTGMMFALLDMIFIFIQFHTQIFLFKHIHAVYIANASKLASYIFLLYFTGKW